MDRYMKQAIDRQQKELLQWEKILKPEFYKELEQMVKMYNDGALGYCSIIRSGVPGVVTRILYGILIRNALGLRTNII